VRRRPVRLISTLALPRALSPKCGRGSERIALVAGDDRFHGNRYLGKSARRAPRACAPCAICPSCQSVAPCRACPVASKCLRGIAHASDRQSYFAWGCFRYFGYERPLRVQHPAFPAPLCPENLRECANGRFSHDRPSLCVKRTNGENSRASNVAERSSVSVMTSTPPHSPLSSSGPVRTIQYSRGACD
jgi:hypothetical protein